MLRRRYKHLFPQTFSTKSVIAPYNNKRKYKLRAIREKRNSELLKKYGSGTRVDLNKLDDFSSANPHLHLLLLEAGQILKTTTNAIGVAVYIVPEDSSEMYLLTGQPLVTTRHFMVEEGTTVAAHVAFSREYVLVEDIRNDQRFPDGTGFHNKVATSVLCVPVVTPEGQSFAVFELIKSTYDRPFDKDDLKIVIVVAGWIGATIHQNLQRIAIKKKEILHDQLLNITKSYFQQRTTTSKMLTDLVALSKETIDVSSGTFYVVDKDKEELTAHVYEESLDENNYQLIKKNLPVEPLQKDRGIVSIVAKSGYTINVKDPSTDPRIGQEPELRTGRTINSMLCMPIIAHSGLVGIIKLLNKRSGYFNKKDEAVLKIFRSYASCSLHYNILDERLKKMVLLGKINERALNLELKPCNHEHFTPKNIVMTPSNFLDFKWYVSEKIMRQAPQLAVHMIKDLCGDKDTNYNVLADFILVVRRLYRKNPYHNFEHAFNFMHCMYNILKRNLRLFSEIEIKALLISSICHDIDHGGCTNNFLTLTNDIVHQLYEESPWENYHFWVTTKLLEKYEIFKMNDTNFELFVKEVKEAILSTDLQQHFRNRKSLLTMINNRSFDFSNTSHRSLLKGLMMTVCDLCGQCKPFSIAKRITENVYREFYNQGDREKRLGIIPLSMMDREKEDLMPEDQIHFISVIVSPATEILGVLLPNTIELNKECMALQSSWKDIFESREKKTKTKTDSD